MSETRPRLTALEWDSQHFQFPVARIEGDAVAPDDLAGLLVQARAAGVRLVYWNGPPEGGLPPELLARFDGALVDRKVTLTRPLDGNPPPPGESPRGACLIRAWPRGLASDSLVRLAVAAGERSRFRVDPRFPPALFESLYVRWIQRSTNGEIADAVLAALEPHSQEPLGLITVAGKAGVGHIGLLAVDGRARGCGLGSALLAAAHVFMVARGYSSASVVTQGDNEPALRLYDRAGYHIAVQSNVHHFWPLAKLKEGRDER
jgi:ribosomal protein S18 acetylase RimI-like enzyme